MPLQGRLHDPPLDAFAPAVYEPYFLEARGCRRGHVLIDDRNDLTRREGMKVDLCLDGNVMHAPLHDAND